MVIGRSMSVKTVGLDQLWSRDASRKTRRRSSFVSLLTLLVVLQTATPAWAWGTLGHRVIARLTEKLLRPEAKAAVAAVREPNETLADASLWADKVRDQMRHTAPWHYVDVPLDEPAYDKKWSADDTKHGCVVDKINEFRKVVGDKGKSIEERRFALRFLVHCLQDMHQPCHVSANRDQGGNNTTLAGSIADRRCTAPSIPSSSTPDGDAHLSAAEHRVRRADFQHRVSAMWAVRRRIPNVGLEPTPPLRGPDFESGSSAIAVALETGCGGAGSGYTEVSGNGCSVGQLRLSRKYCWWRSWNPRWLQPTRMSSGVENDPSHLGQEVG
jgi:hypothetical protein